MPDADAKDPHTPIFDAKGRLWFSVQGGNKIGRIDPSTGEVRLVDSLTPKSRPYGVKLDSKGVPYVVLFGTNKVARLDPETMQIREYALPEGARPRRMEITADDAVWYSESNVKPNTLVRFDPKTEKFQTWTIPSGGGVIRHMHVRGREIGIACSGVNAVGIVAVR